MREIVMRVHGWTWVAAACCSVLVWPSDSFGQASVMADQLFSQGVDQMKPGNFASACPRIERSYQLDPKDWTLFTLAKCRDNEGKRTAALGHYRAYLRMFGAMTGAARQKHAGRAATATAQIAAIEPVLPKVKFIWETPPPAESRIVVDDIEFRPDTLDALLPLDPGTHKIVVQLPGEPQRTRTVTLAKGGSTIIDLTPAKPQTDTAIGAATGKGGKGMTGPGSGANRKRDPAKIAGFVGIGVGAAGLVAGAITGGMTISEKRAVDERCNDAYVCDTVGMAAVDRMNTFGNTSTALFIAGGVLAGVGVTLVLVSKRVPKTAGANVRMTTAIAPGMTNFVVEGVF